MTPTTRADALEALDSINGKTFCNQLESTVYILNKIEPHFDTIRAALTQGQWHPIETAPRDRWILGVNTRGKPPYIPVVMRSSFIKDEDFTSCEVGSCWKERLADWPIFPTHWMPLPSPPDKLTGRGEG